MTRSKTTPARRRVRRIHQELNPSVEQKARFERCACCGGWIPPQDSLLWAEAEGTCQGHVYESGMCSPPAATGGFSFSIGATTCAGGGHPVSHTPRAHFGQGIMIPRGWSLRFPR